MPGRVELQPKGSSALAAMPRVNAWLVFAAGQHLLNVASACAVAAIGWSKKPQVEADSDANPRPWGSGNVHAGHCAPRITDRASTAMVGVRNDGVDRRANIATHFCRLRH